MVQNKVEVVLSWKTPGSLMEVQAFLGFANFYWRFIKDYSRVVRPLTELTKKTEQWTWNDKAEGTFEELKQWFTSAPILAHFDPQKPVIIETDASDFAIRAVLSQRDEEGRLHPVAFHSRKFQPAEINYEIHDKELLAVIDAFKHWRHYCEGTAHQIQVLSDHRNLEYFTMIKVLNWRQARWAQELAGIDFRIYYHPGSRNGKPDALSRRTEYRPEKGEIENQPITKVLQENQVADRQGHSFICSLAWLASLTAKRWRKEFVQRIQEAGKEDMTYRQAWKVVKEEQEEAALSEKQRMDRKARSRDLEIWDELLY